MAYRMLADAVVVLHASFVAFVALGGLLVLRWPRLALVQLPCALYGLLIEIFRWTCPLTPLENRFRMLGGEAGYTGGFIEHHLLPLVYPDPFPPWLAAALAGVVLVTNGLAYGALAVRSRRRAQRPPRGG